MFYRRSRKAKGSSGFLPDGQVGRFRDGALILSSKDISKIKQSKVSKWNMTLYSIYSTQWLRNVFWYRCICEDTVLHQADYGRSIRAKYYRCFLVDMLNKTNIILLLPSLLKGKDCLLDLDEQKPSTRQALIGSKLWKTLWWPTNESLIFIISVLCNS